MRTGWILQDNFLDDTYMLPVNPFEDGGSFGIEHNNSYAVGGVANYVDEDDELHIGGTLIHETPDTPRSFSFTGHTYDSAQLLTLYAWANKDYAVTLIDDLGRQFAIMFTGIDIQRVRTRNQWKHRYTITGRVFLEA